MRQSILSIIALFILGFCVGSCATDQSEKEAKEEARKAKEDLDKATIAYQQEVEDYRNDVAAQIQENQDMIAQLKAERLNLKKDAQLEREARINELEKRNDLMRARMNEYKYKSKEGWENFKREFKHDMSELGQAFKNIGSDNVKNK